MTENEVLRMLAKIPDGHFIMIDGHELRNERIREATEYAVGRRWLDLGELIEGDQWSWYEAKITPEGRAAIAALTTPPAPESH